MASLRDVVLRSDVCKVSLIVLRWGVQRGCSVITKTTETARSAENLNIFDFALTEQEMLAVAGLNKNRRFNDPGDFCEAAFNTFYPIYD